MWNSLKTPFGEMLLSGEQWALTGVWLPTVDLPDDIFKTEEKTELPVFDITKKWFEIYFSGRNPGFLPPLKPEGTEFRKMVWQKLCNIPYGETSTYGAIAREIEIDRPGALMSAQAVGGAVSHNPIPIIIPCHRVIGKDGKLVGYFGGMELKKELLKLEGIL